MGGGSQKASIYWGNCLKKGGLDILQIYGGIRQKEELVFLRGEFKGLYPNEDYEIFC